MSRVDGTSVEMVTLLKGASFAPKSQVLPQRVHLLYNTDIADQIFFFFKNQNDLYFLSAW